MDFSKLSVVKTANPKVQDFQLKWKRDKDAFRISNDKFAEMQLAHNSLAQYGEEGKVFLGVHPGDSGVFYKTRKGLAKGKTFKNTNLSNRLSELGAPDDLQLEYRGLKGEIRVFEITWGGQETEEPTATEVAADPEPQAENQAAPVEEDDNF